MKMIVLLKTLKIIKNCKEFVVKIETNQISIDGDESIIL